MHNINFKSLILFKDWEYIMPNEKDIYFITNYTFHNGKKYEIYSNQWIKFACNSGYVSVYNLKDPYIIIHKIHKTYILHIDFLHLKI